MKIETFHLIKGAGQAEGLTVIIDVFRAFSMECYLYAAGAAEVRPTGTIEETFAWKEKDPGCLLAGERHGRRIEGCDLGNSPSSVDPGTVRGKRIIHTTSAGTQGIVNAVHAEEILTGSFVNAGAVAEYIRRRDPEKVSLVCMGKEGLAPAEEDELCAVYLADLRFGGGSHFFDPELRDVYPEQDFWMCIARDRFGFVLKIEKDEQGYLSRRIDLF